MGSCEADYCYIERKPADGHGKYWITKGCVRRPPRKTLGCDYDYFQDHILCVCYGLFFQLVRFESSSTDQDWN